MNPPPDADWRTVIRFAEEQVLRPLLRGLGIDAFIEIRHREEGTILSLEHGTESGRLIGKDGHTLAAIQYLVNLLAAAKFGTTRAILVDCAGYRERYKSGLDRTAQEAARTVQRTGKPVTLEPMSAADRRLVHTALRDWEGIETVSVDEDPETGTKRVRVAPVGYVPPAGGEPEEEPPAPFGDPQADPENSDEPWDPDEPLPPAGE
jgi:predicted RNA-binding protein Jag